MKMVLAGNWLWPMYEQACAGALRELGVDVIPFEWNRYFNGLLGKIEAHTMVNIIRVRKLNNDLIELCRKASPDVLFVWKGIHIENNTLETIRDMGVLLVSYNNDDPFSEQYSRSWNINQRRIWIKFRKNLPLYDMNFVYRSKNITDYQTHGLERVHLLPSYYIPEHNMPLNLHRGVEFEGVFIGHYEPDERFSCIKALQRAGIKVKIYGSGWEKCREDGYHSLGDIQPVHGSTYNKTLNKAHFALCFFSKLNNDQYTRRAFEIPASGTLLVSRRTDEMEKLYKDGEEAVFFDDEAELVKRITILLSAPDTLKRIADSGHRRCMSSGYDMKSRMEKMLTHIRPLLAK